MDALLGDLRPKPKDSIRRVVRSFVGGLFSTPPETESPYGAAPFPFDQEEWDDLNRRLDERNSAL